MPRVRAHVGLLRDYAERVEDLDWARRQRTADLSDALQSFRASGSAFGDPSLEVVSDLEDLWRQTVDDAHAVLATAAAFSDAEVVMGSGLQGLWMPDDAWIETRRRSWLAERTPVAADVMQRMDTAAEAGASALLRTQRRLDHARRLREVMEVHGLDRVGAAEHLTVMDATIAGLIESGLAAEGAVMAFALADALELDLQFAQREAARSALGIVDVLGRMAMADALGLDYRSLATFEAFEAHFDVFDDATGGTRDGAVSIADLLHVVDNPDDFVPAQVLAAQAILAEPILFSRLDSAAENLDIIDGQPFGNAHVADRLVSRDDIDAFLVRSRLNHLLGDHALALDTAADGGRPDGFFSENDLEAWLDANGDAQVEVRDAVRYMLDAGLVDRSFLEANRDALAMGAAVVAGGVVIVASGGSATPLVLAIGFGAGGAAAGLTTIGLNRINDENLAEGMLANAIDGGLIGLSVAGLPSAVGNAATALRGGLSVHGLAVGAGAAGEAASIVGSGGVDVILPDDWEDEVHGGAGVIENIGAFSDLAIEGIDNLILHIDDIGVALRSAADVAPAGWLSRRAQDGPDTVWDGP